MKSQMHGITVMAATLAACVGTAVAAGADPAARLFALDEVRLLPGPFKAAQDTDLKYILAHDPDRFLAPFRREAGLPEKAKPYGNWESMGLDGHTAGHYLAALAMMHAATGDAECKRRMDYMVGELAECQRAFGDGYVGGVPRSKALWDDIAAGRMKVTGFGLNDRWVPWYNIHKTYAGLRDAYHVGKNEQAKLVLIGMADWCCTLIGKLSDQQLQQMLRAEHGGMDEVLADVYAITGDGKYLAAARRFCDRQILDALAANRDELTGKHANTQIPKVIGFERIAALDGDAAMHQAALYFWDNVTSKRSVSIGGNSNNEHFNDPANFRGLLEDRTGPETCNTYNMLRLSEALFAAEPTARIGDFYERAIYNHILSTQDPKTGGFVYFTPMRPQHYRVYSAAEKGFWCCVGTGFENHAKYGQFVYARGGGKGADELLVNLFIPSVLTWAERGLTLRQETAFPNESKTRLTFGLQQPAEFSLRIRVPDWLAATALDVRVNGQPVSSRADSAGFASVRREWREGDVVDVALPMRVEAETLPDRSPFVSFRYGPVVLAAKTGTQDLKGLFAGEGRGDHIAPGPMLPMSDAPTLIDGGTRRLADAVRRVASDELMFEIDGAVQPASFADLKLVPFSSVHESRYVIYWPVASAAKYAAQREEVEAAERAKLAFEAATFDRVIAGAQQSEVDHGFKGEQTGSGNFRDRSWRDSRAWFSYELKVPSDQDADLLVTYFGGDRDRNFDVLVNEKTVASLRLDGSAGQKFVTERYALDRRTSDQPMTIKFVAKPGSVAGGIYEVRIVRRGAARAKG